MHLLKVIIIQAMEQYLQIIVGNKYNQSEVKRVLKLILILFLTITELLNYRKR